MPVSELEVPLVVLSFSRGAAEPVDRQPILAAKSCARETRSFHVGNIPTFMDAFLDRA